MKQVAQEKVYLELPPFTGRNVPIIEIAKAMHKDAQYVRVGLQPAESCDPPQHNETSVEGRLGENHGGAEGPMDPVSCRTSDDLPQRMHFRGCRGQIRKDHIGPKI